MYSKQRNTNTSSKLADVRVGVDKGSLRLQFSTRISKKFYQKPQKYVGLGRSDTPENRIYAETIARKIQADIDYPDGGMFDPTLTKYLDVKPALASVTMLPTAKPIPTLGKLWTDYADWKFKTEQIGETTYIKRYQKSYPRMMTDFLSQSFDRETADKLIETLVQKKKCKSEVKLLLNIFSAMCQWYIGKKILTEDYFSEIKKFYKVPKKSKQQSEEENFQAYTIEQRDLIIEAFRNCSRPNTKHLSDLIEFLFLTGCRHGEAFALRWKNIKFDKGCIVFDESYDTKTGITKDTKTGNTRIFRLKGMNRLTNLLIKMHGNGKDDNELVFKTLTGQQTNSRAIGTNWCKSYSIKNGKTYIYDGVVTELAKQGLIPYLKPYATRHTFISIQANNGCNLKLLADMCGNSVDIIMEHYLQLDDSVMMKDI
ncbi:tyrosine-type recombinase/integrase [Scytonema sp. NUACC26]|uniref:tyrosine-type recombinase/integrase n=1 Tax=Scytonema sp. NUACC26 TaxID=3140176 RepID=UPI0034DC8A31